MAKIKPGICAILVAALLPAFVACASGPGRRSQNGLDELVMATRAVSNHLNNNIPEGNMIAFLNIESQSAALSDFIIDDLIANAVNDRLFTVVDRHRLEQIRTEQNFQLSGEVSDETAIRIGHIYGVQTIVSGSLSPFGANHRLTIHALDVQTAQVKGQYNRTLGPAVSALIHEGAAGGAATGGAAAATRQPGVFVTNARRNAVEASLAFLWEGGEDARSATVMGLGGHWSPLPFATVGLEAGLGWRTLDEDEFGRSEVIYLFTASPTVGAVLPIGGSARFFANASLDLGNFGQWDGLITDWATPGFGAGLEFDLRRITDNDGIFAIRYRGVLFHDSYAHGISAGFGFRF